MAPLHSPTRGRPRPLLAVRRPERSAQSVGHAEVYPALRSRSFPTHGRTQHQQDAFATAKWMQTADRDGDLGKSFNPRLEPDEWRKAEIEGWILAVL